VSLNQITREAKGNFVPLLNKVWQLRQEYDKKYTIADARTDFFSAFAESNLWLLIQLDSFLEILDRNNDRISKYMTMDSANRTKFLAQYDTINRAAFCTKAMFDVEHFLRLLAKGLQLALQNNNYGTLADEVLRSVGLTTSDSLLILKNIAHIRNSLHNNGFVGYDFVILIGSNRYSFTKGQQVYYTGWDNLYIMFDKLIDTLVEIINSKKLKSIKIIPHNSEFSRYDIPPT
jgi:hypothetical protein